MLQANVSTIYIPWSKCELGSHKRQHKTSFSLLMSLLSLTYASSKSPELPIPQALLPAKQEQEEKYLLGFFLSFFFQLVNNCQFVNFFRVRGVSSD